MNLDLAVVIQQHPTELDREHSMRVLIQHADGQRLGEAELKWQTADDQRRLRDLPMPVVLPLRHVRIPTPAEYSIEILIDNVHQTSLPFTVSDVAPPGSTPKLGLPG